MISMRSVFAAGLLILASLLSTGCMLGAKVATDVENAGNKREFANNLAILKHHIKTLQAQGDPLGDYFYALANSDGWIKDVKDPQAITALFEQAAAKGSMDARILLALQEAGDDPKPGQLDVGFVPRESLKGWESGLAKLLPLLQQQCYARRLVIGDPVLSEARPQVGYYSIAYAIWPNFEHGYYRRNADGTKTLLKDPERFKLWKAIDEKCNHQDECLDILYQNRK